MLARINIREESDATSVSYRIAIGYISGEKKGKIQTRAETTGASTMPRVGQLKLGWDVVLKRP